tara:strand:+ start:10251 stop:11459 length:1209 start_codon:yes stop_codon:yes gene_type:complete
MQKIIGGIFLVASIAIGAGMLALPITTGVAGFTSSAIVFVVAFVVMLYSVLLLLEANLYSASGSNVISMAKNYLGKYGQLVAWLMYLLLLYAVVAAYTSGGGSLFNAVLQDVIGVNAPAWVGAGLFVLLFGFFVFFGTRSVDYLNRGLTLGLIVAYVALILFVTPHIHMHLLSSGHAHYIWAAIPVIVLSFTSHLIVPSLRVYYKSNIKHLLIVLIVGSVIPLVLYLVWELTVLGIVPVNGKDGLESIAGSQNSVTALTAALTHFTGVAWLGRIANFFSFFALVTSFLGASLSLSHFLKDGFKQGDHTRSRIWNIVLTYVPPFIFAMAYPRGFIAALSYGGVFIAVLFGILPCLIVWKARYRQQQHCGFRVPGGRVGLVLMMLVSVFIIVMQIAATLNLLPG